MSSTIQIGRARLSIEVAVETLQVRGDTLRLDAWCDGTAALVAATVEILRAYEQEVDETVVPVVFDAPLEHLTGFYRLGGVSVGQAWADRSDITIELDRVQGYAAPKVESVLIGGQRATSSAALVTGRAWHAIPAAARHYESGLLTLTTLTLDSETGQLRYFYEGTQGSPAHFYNSRPSWYLSPADWYDGAAELTVGGYLVAGRQVRNLPADWSISNGLVKLAGGSGGTLTTHRWSGTTWEAPGAWKIGRTLGTGQDITIDALGAPDTLTVLRNDPACVAVRCSYDAASIVAGSYFAVDVDYSLRRGSSVVEVTLSTRGEYRWGFYSPITYASLALGNDAATDGTFVAAGVSEFSANDDGAGKTRFGLTTYTGNGRTFDQWGWGYLVGGQSFLFVSQQWAASQSERVQVVAR